MVGVRRELGGCWVVENQCVGRHVDTTVLIINFDFLLSKYLWSVANASFYMIYPLAQSQEMLQSRSFPKTPTVLSSISELKKSIMNSSKCRRNNVLVWTSNRSWHSRNQLIFFISVDCRSSWVISFFFVPGYASVGFSDYKIIKLPLGLHLAEPRFREVCPYQPVSVDQHCRCL